MSKQRKQPPFWLRREPNRRYDISLLRPASWSKKRRFETEDDATAESLRSSEVLRAGNRDQQELADELDDCRGGERQCDLPCCPICAREFRRWITAELLRVTTLHTNVTILTILLKAAERGTIDGLDLGTYRSLLRKRLQRSGLGNASVIGGFEIVYKAKAQSWVLHINLVVIDGKAQAIRTFKNTFEDSEMDRPVVEAGLTDAPKQLSYLLKFSTYHRPFQQAGPGKSPAKSLNAPEHLELVQWMAKHDFADFLFLFSARRNGPDIRLKADD